MYTTLAAILKLPIMKDAVLLTGESKMNNIVNSLSVTDYFSTELLYEELFKTSDFLTGELILSGFILRYPVEKQKEFIRLLNDAGSSGLIIFNVGFLFDGVDQEVKAYCDELEFPIIVMPSNRFLYSEVITHVTRDMYKTEDKANDLMNMVLIHLSQLPEHQRIIDHLIRFISNYTHVSIGLYDKHFAMLHKAHWRLMKDTIFANETLTSLYTEDTDVQSGSFVSEEGTTVYYSLTPVSLDNDMIRYVTILSEFNFVDELLKDQIIEVIRVFYTIWGKSELNSRELVKAIINNQVTKSKQIANIFHIDLEKLEAFLIATPINKMNEEQLEGYVVALENHFKKHHLRVIADVTEGNIIIFIERPPYEMDLTEVLEEIVDQITKDEYSFLMEQRLSSMTKAGAIYHLYLDHLEQVRQIFPYKMFLSKQDFKFAKTCMDIIQNGEAILNEHLQVIELLEQEDLRDTLFTYLLDADAGVKKTSELLFIHESTVKYRINNINETLGYSIRRMPEGYQLYLAAGLMRLLH